MSEWLAVEAIVMQCDREALEANIARLSAEQNAAAAAGAASSAEAAVRSAAAMLEVADEGVEADEPGSTPADDGAPQEATAAAATRQRGKMRGIMMRLTDDGFGGSLSSDGGGSKQETPVLVGVHGEGEASTGDSDAGRRQKFFVTNPTVDDASTMSVTAAAAAAAADFDHCTFTQLPSDGTSTTANCCFSPTTSVVQVQQSVRCVCVCVCLCLNYL